MEIRELLRDSRQKKASDVFLNAGKVPAVRISGEIVMYGTETVSGEEISALRQSLITPLQEKNYQLRGDVDCSIDDPLCGRMRLNFFECAEGSCMVARPIGDGSALTFENLGLPEYLREVCGMTRGLVLVVGSTGSGKSSTLGALINEINSKYCRHIVTFEDPIETRHTDILSRISQRELHSDGEEFHEALRSVLRESPDVIVIGECRDAETMQTAITAALTGHLVITTLHTMDAVQSVERIISLFPDDRRELAAADLSTALICIAAQRLLKRRDGNGRVAALEILTATPLVKKHIAEFDYRSLEDVLRSQHGNNGMQNFNRVLLDLYQQKQISLKEACSYAGNKDEFMLLVKGMESGTDTFRSFYSSEEYKDKNAVDMRRLLRAAVKTGASDLHLSVGSVPILRLDGQLRELELPVLDGADTQRLFYSILSRRQRIEFEEKRELDFAMAASFSLGEGMPNQLFRFRINGYFQRGSVGVAVRVVNSKVLSPKDLNLPPAIINLTQKHQGLILVTGPTGSGKSTTLASLIDYINQSRSAHIITVEDPIEFVHANKKSLIEQREVHSDTLSFAASLKYALRQDPDIIMVGEMRDTETISAALTAAETGHLVFGTLHTNNAPQTVDRIIDSFPAHQQNQIRLQLAGVLLAVLSQRLLPRTDGKGRCAAFEVMVGTPPVRALISENKTAMLVSTIETGFRDGMITMERSLEELHRQGLITRAQTRLFSLNGSLPDSF